MGRGDEAFDTSKDLAAKVECAEAIFSPRFVSVIVASLTKLGTKFPEFAPRVVLCLLKMQQHYATDFSEGMDFVRDRLSDSLQLLRHSAISSSVYSSVGELLGFEMDRSLSSLSVLSSLGHLSHDPSAFTSGAALHDFELPHQPPNVAAAHGDAWSERPAGAWWEAQRAAPAPATLPEEEARPSRHEEASRSDVKDPEARRSSKDPAPSSGYPESRNWSGTQWSI
ncbi:unnamed protein product [Durusdinium trenchii]|uniref:AP-5 complex subunit zeta-1 C-terminal TPR domain-containing protein n=1 Tax=Durusdinium trenchii TaxID=1381693 RepID=A0ABP0RQ93_9DINO